MAQSVEDEGFDRGDFERRGFDVTARRAGREDETPFRRQPLFEVSRTCEIM